MCTFTVLQAIIDKSVFAAVADTLCTLDNHESYTAEKYKVRSFPSFF